MKLIVNVVKTVVLTLMCLVAQVANACEYCGSYTQVCVSYTQVCDHTIQQCDYYNQTCSTVDSDGNCTSYSYYCGSYSTVCTSYSERCSQYQSVCDSYYYGEYINVSSNVSNSGNGTGLPGIAIGVSDVNSNSSKFSYTNASGNSSLSLFVYDDLNGNITVNTCAAASGYYPPSTCKSSTFVDRCDSPNVPVAFSMAPPALGYVERLAGGVITGWAVDPSSPQTNIAVHFYADGQAGAGGTFVGLATANIIRPDVNSATGYSGNHGFQFTIPNTYLHGPHKFFAYAISVNGGNNPLLTNSPIASLGSLSGLSHGIITGTDSGPIADVKVFHPINGDLLFQVNPFGSFTGGVRVALGDVNHDGVLDVITAAGPGGGPNVTVYSGVDGAILYNFFAYAPSLTTGVFVASADVNGDGYSDIITTPDMGGGPQVRVYSGSTGGIIRDFMALDSDFRGGLRVATGDVDHDGFADIIVTPGSGGGPRVEVFSGQTGQVIRNFYAFDPSFRLGLYIGAGDIDGDGYADIITGVGLGGGPHVQAFSGHTGAQIASYFAYAASFRGGVRVAGADLSGDGRSEIITAAGPGGGPHVEAFDGLDLSHIVQSFFAEAASLINGVFVSAK